MTEERPKPGNDHKRSGGVNRTRTIEEASRILPAHVSKAALRAQQQERADRADALRVGKAAIRDINEMTAGLDRLPDGTILGPTGAPILKPVVKDFSSLTSEGVDDPVRAYAEDTLMRAARMDRDGVPLRQIAEALNIEGIVPLPMLNAALINVGHPLLAAAIARGEEPEETKVVIGYEAVLSEQEKAEDAAESVAPTITGARPIRKRGSQPDPYPGNH